MTPKLAASAAFATIGVACLIAAFWIHLKAFAAQVLINAAWDRTQQGASDARPWPWADTTPVARITFHNWKSLVVLEGSSGRNLAFAPTHDPASVLPGEAGNSVVSAHRDTHFSELRHARLGDGIRVERTDGRSYVFTVTDMSVVDSRRVRLALADDESRITLVTCYPFDAIQPGGPLRFVVTAILSESRSAVAGHLGDSPSLYGSSLDGYTPPRRVARAAALPRPVPFEGLFR